MIPPMSECIKVMDRYSMLENIKAHSIMVTKVAYILSSLLLETGKDISIKKIVAASLLHDIGKTKALKTGEDHTKIGVNICLENGFYEIADIIAEHVVLKEFHIKPLYNEKEIVYYSDKRVNDDKVVSLDERLSYILRRYGKGDNRMHEAIKRNFELCRKLEENIFKEISLVPEDISLLVNEVVFEEEKDLIRWQKKIRYLK